MIVKEFDKCRKRLNRTREGVDDRAKARRSRRHDNVSDSAKPDSPLSRYFGRQTMSHARSKVCVMGGGNTPAILGAANYPGE